MDQLIDLTKDMPVFHVDDRGYYHHIMSLIISQRIRFRQGQKIRSKIYELQGRNDLLKITELTNTDRATVGLGDNKWATIIAFHNGGDVQSIKGIGPWTIQCAKIMAGDYSVGFIATDLAVRKWVSAAMNADSVLSERSIISLVSKLDKIEAGMLFSKIWNHTRQ
jgi:3-methyladenine DNA glycosylase/8-oxoguanine DNA glycosylase